MVHLTYIMLNDIEMKCLLKFFLKVVFVLISQHNVHLMHIIQALLMINLMVFEERGEKYDLLILRELCGIVLLQHKIQHYLIKYEIIIYYVHVIMHMQLILYYLKEI